MDEDDFCEECEEEVEPVHTIGVAHWSWLVPVILAVQVVEETMQAVSDGLNGLKVSLCAHAGYQADREAVREMEEALKMSSADTQ